MTVIILTFTKSPVETVLLITNRCDNTIDMKSRYLQYFSEDKSITLVCNVLAEAFGLIFSSASRK